MNISFDHQKSNLDIIKSTQAYNKQLTWSRLFRRSGTAPCVRPACRRSRLIGGGVGAGGEKPLATRLGDISIFFKGYQ